MDRVVVDTRDWRAVAKVLGGRRTDAVLSFSHHFSPVAAAAAETLGTRGLGVAALALCADKAAVRKTLADTPFTLAHWTLRPEDPVTLGPLLQFPVVAKPVGETSSTHVTRVDDDDELARAVARIRALERNRKGFLQDGMVLLEDIASGPEFSVETMTWAGRTFVYGITAKLPLESHPFIEQADSFPDPRPEVNEALGGAAESILDAVRGFCGPAHLEIRLTPAGPRLIEINARQPGGFVPDLVRWTTGRDIFVDTVCGVLEVAAPRFRQSSRAATWWQVYPSECGRVTRCSVPALVRNALGVAHVALNVSEGDEVCRPIDNHGRIGDLLVLGDSIAETLNRAALLAAAFVLEIRESPRHQHVRNAN
jgi:biotin carboxylase